MNKLTVGIMWTILGGVAITALIMSPVLGSGGWITAIAALGIGIPGTAMLIEAHDKETSRQSRRRERDIAKPKRTRDDKYDLLMRMMDDDEREAFKQILQERYLGRVNSDGELPIDADLFEDEDELKSKTRWQ